MHSGGLNREDISEAAVMRFWDKVSPQTNGCWLWASVRVFGKHPCFWMDGRPRGVQKISYALDRGELPARCLVLPTCSNSLCVNPRHLVAVEVESIDECNIDWDIVRSIRLEARLGVTDKVLADKHQISSRHVASIRMNRVWCDDEYDPIMWRDG